MVATKPSTRKAKGRILENKVRDDLVNFLGIDPKDILSTPMSSAGCDIFLGVESRKRFPFGIECKNQEHLNIWDAINQLRDKINALTSCPGDMIKINDYCVLKLTLI